jgi:putative transcriptional regulator
MSEITSPGLSGSLLIAMPQLQDPNFKRTVLLMVHHDESSSFGLVLNRPADLPVAELFSGLEFSWHGGSKDTVSWGGPVELNSGWMLFGQADVAGEADDDVTEVVPGVLFAGSLEVFREVAEAPPDHVRFFLGYSGWGPGQLEFEIAQGAWLSAPVTPEAVFVTPAEKMWDHVVRGLGIDPSTLVSTSGVH